MTPGGDGEDVNQENPTNCVISLYHYFGSEVQQQPQECSTPYPAYLKLYEPTSSQQGASHGRFSLAVAQLSRPCMTMRRRRTSRRCLLLVVKSCLCSLGFFLRCAHTYELEIENGGLNTLLDTERMNMIYYSIGIVKGSGLGFMLVSALMTPGRFMSVYRGLDGRGR